MLGTSDNIDSMYLDTTEQQEGIKFDYYSRDFTLPPKALTRCILMIGPTGSDLKTCVGYLITQQPIKLKEHTAFRNHQHVGGNQIQIGKEHSLQSCKISCHP